MVAVTISLAAVAVIAAFANWWSRWAQHRPTERWSKPLTLLALIGVAVTLDAADPTVRAWFVAGLVLSLVGDVFLLDGDRWFVAGLGAFLAGHVAYIVGFVVADTWRWWAVSLAAAVVGVVAATVGRRIVSAAAARSPSLRLPVAAYLGVISVMVVAAAAAGNGWAIAGALAFLVSDATLGWGRFVRPGRWTPLAVMVTYHLAQAGLVASLR